MEDRFKSASIRNFLKSLAREDALRIVSLAMAANDLVVNAEAIGRFSESKNIYFFVSSLSILREVSKLVAEIDEFAFRGRMSADTIAVLNDVKGDLASFESGGLVKDTLKPIRDVTFHYDHLGQKGDIGRLIDKGLSKVIRKDDLEIGFSNKLESTMGQRYFFAESFRSEILSQLLSDEVIGRISSTSVNVVSLVDSLLLDLKEIGAQ